MKEAMKNIFNTGNLLPAIFLILPFMIILVCAPLGSGITIHASHQFALYVFSIILMAGITNNKWLMAFSFYACLWTFFILIFTVNHPEIPLIVSKNAFDALNFILVGMIIYVSVLKSKISKETFYNVICISSLIQSILAFFQYLWIDPFLWAINAFFYQAVSLLNPHVLTGTLGNNNFLAAYLAISLPFFFRKNWFYGLIIIVPCLIICKTTSAFIPAIIGIIYYFYPKGKTKINIAIISLLSVLGTYYAFIYRPFVNNPRWEMWTNALEQILYSSFSFICGFGPGAGWGQSFPMHNEWLQGMHQYGLIGMIIIVGFIVGVFRKTDITKEDQTYPVKYSYKIDRLLFASLIIALVNMFGNYSLHLAPSAMLIIIVLGLIEREKINEIS